MPTFADVLRNLRTEAGWTQQQLADKSGIPISSIRGHEQGQRVPSWASVVKLAKALGVSTDAFAECDEVKGEDEPPAKMPKRPKK
ncbi:helix-turn-helix transcriptional regulator [bacterium]|nr:helix-turn-helix transcriptional regulator [bacterium]